MLTGGRKVLGEFKERLEDAIKTKRSRLGINLDPLPESDVELPNGMDMNTFLDQAIDSVAPFVTAFKLNTQHFIYRFPTQRIEELVRKIHSHGVPVIADHKLADIGSSNSVAVYRIIERMGFDGITIHPIIGWEDGIDIISEQTKKLNAGLFSVIYMSHLGAKDFYDLEIRGKPLYDLFLDQALERNLTGIVVGATRTRKLDEISRKILKTKSRPVILTVGYGKQGGDVNEIPSSVLQLNFLAFIGRSVLYSYLNDTKVSFSQAIEGSAKEYRDLLNNRIARK